MSTYHIYYICRCSAVTGYKQSTNHISVGHSGQVGHQDPLRVLPQCERQWQGKDMWLIVIVPHNMFPKL